MNGGDPDPFAREELERRLAEAEAEAAELREHVSHLIAQNNALRLRLGLVERRADSEEG